MKYTKMLFIVYLLCFATWTFASEDHSKQGILDSLEYYLENAKAYTHYQNRKVFADIDRLIVNGINEYALSNQIEKRLIRFLKTDASLASKQMICFQLSIHGTKSSVKILEKMLKSPETFDMALFALERLPYSDVDKVLKKFLSKSVNIGIINTLGRRRSKKAISELKSLTTLSDSKIRKAC